MPHAVHSHISGRRSRIQLWLVLLSRQSCSSSFRWTLPPEPCLTQHVLQRMGSWSACCPSTASRWATLAWHWGHPCAQRCGSCRSAAPAGALQLPARVPASAPGKAAACATGACKLHSPHSWPAQARGYHERAEHAAYVIIECTCCVRRTAGWPGPMAAASRLSMVAPCRRTTHRMACGRQERAERGGRCAGAPLQRLLHVLRAADRGLPARAAPAASGECAVQDRAERRQPAVRPAPGGAHPYGHVRPQQSRLCAGPACWRTQAAKAAWQRPASLSVQTQGLDGNAARSCLCLRQLERGRPLQTGNSPAACSPCTS